MALAINGWSHDQGSARRGKKREPIPPTGPNAASSGACCVKRAASPSAWWWTEPIGTTCAWSRRRWRAFLLNDPGFGRIGVRTCVSTKDTTMTRFEDWQWSSDTRRISGPEAKKPRKSRSAPASRRGDGWLSARTVGSIVSAISSCAGRRKRGTTSAFFTSSAPSLRFVMLVF